MTTVVGMRAWRNAGLPDCDPTRLMVSIGTAMGGTPAFASAYEDTRTLGPSSVHPFAVQMYAANGHRPRQRAATATTVGDVVESVAINHAMGGHRPAVYAPKSSTGHSVGPTWPWPSAATDPALRHDGDARLAAIRRVHLG